MLLLKIKSEKLDDHLPLICKTRKLRAFIKDQEGVGNLRKVREGMRWGNH